MRATHSAPALRSHCGHRSQRLCPHPGRGRCGPDPRRAHPAGWVPVRVATRRSRCRADPGLHSIHACLPGPALHSDATCGHPERTVARVHGRTSIRALVLGALPGRRAHLSRLPDCRPPETVFWVSTKTVLGSDYCAVTQDAKCPGGCTLRRGVYVPFQAISPGSRLPPLSDLLADSTKTDLAPRFQESARDAASARTVDQPLRSWATRASACSTVTVLRFGMG